MQRGFATAYYYTLDLSHALLQEIEDEVVRELGLAFRIYHKMRIMAVRASEIASSCIKDARDFSWKIYKREFRKSTNVHKLPLLVVGRYRRILVFQITRICRNMQMHDAAAGVSGCRTMGSFSIRVR